MLANIVNGLLFLGKSRVAEFNADLISVIEADIDAVLVPCPAWKRQFLRQKPFGSP